MIEWKQDEQNKNRTLAMCGDVAVGAIFGTRWRAWVTTNLNPADGTAKNPEAAKREVAERFGKFIAAAKLRSIA